MIAMNPKIAGVSLAQAEREPALAPMVQKKMPVRAMPICKHAYRLFCVVYVLCPSFFVFNSFLCLTLLLNLATEPPKI